MVDRDLQDIKENDEVFTITKAQQPQVDDKKRQRHNSDIHGRGDQTQSGEEYTERRHTYGGYDLNRKRPSGHKHGQQRLSEKRPSGHEHRQKRLSSHEYRQKRLSSGQEYNQHRLSGYGPPPEYEAPPDYEERPKPKLHRFESYEV